MAKLQLFPHIPNIFHHNLVFGLQFNLLFAQNDNKSSIQRAIIASTLTIMINEGFSRQGLLCYATGAQHLRYRLTTFTL